MIPSPAATRPWRTCTHHATLWFTDKAFTGVLAALFACTTVHPYTLLHTND